MLVVKHVKLKVNGCGDVATIVVKRDVIGIGVDGEDGDGVVLMLVMVR